ncbi:MAG: glycosyltransferase [Rhizomicrobium sp.]
MAPSVCIVSNEVYPVDRGGIGRLMYNFATANAGRAAPADLHVLLTSGIAQSEAIEAAYSGLATIHFCMDVPGSLGALGECIRTSGTGDPLNELMVESLRCYGGLLEAQRRCGRDFDVIEFPDFAGWGAATIAAKRSGIAFANTRIAVRLHSTFALIAHHEPFMHEPSAWMAARCDLERQCLRNADLVVAHLESTARANIEWFGFPAAWMTRVRVEMPPILLSKAETTVHKHVQSEASVRAPRDFLFSSRLQPFKRPDVFVRAAVHFLDNGPVADSMFRVASYGWDAEYVDWLKQLVPARWRERVVFLDKVSEQERTRLMLAGILVIPSDYESLCLLAFEARLLNVPTILNRRCAAFGEEPSLWRDGEDCLFFEGDFLSLAETMRRALSWTPAAAPVPQPDPPYWESDPPHTPAVPDRTPLSLALIVYGHVNPYELASELRALAALRLFTIHALVSRDTIGAASFPESALAASAVTLHLTGWTEPTAAEIQSVLAALDCEAVAFLPAGMHVDPELWSLAAARLTQVSEAAVFTSHVLAVEKGAVKSYVLNYGDCPTVALTSDRVAHRASVFRRDVLLELGLRDTAGERWHEDVCIRLVEAGHRVLVAPTALAAQAPSEPLSRIPGSRFFAWHRDMAAQRLGAAFRAGSFAQHADSVIAIGHETWLARQGAAEAELAACTRLAPPGFRFMNAVLKRAALDRTQAYRELEIVLHGLYIGRNFLPWLGIKFAQFRGEPQLEFRESGNARALFRDWPPPTSDQWGPVAVWSTGSTRHPHGQFFEKMHDSDAGKLTWLVQNLPAMLDDLGLPDGEAGDWKSAARRLLPDVDSRRRFSHSDIARHAEPASVVPNGLQSLHRLANRSVRLASRLAGRLSGRHRSNI